MLAPAGSSEAIILITGTEKMFENISSANSAGLVARIEAREAVVSIIGLGYVGLLLAIHFGRQGFKVIGFDVDGNKVEAISQGRSYIKHIPAEPVKELVSEGRFEATSDPARLAEAG